MPQPVPATIIPPQPARLQLGDRELVIPADPVRRKSQSRRLVELHAVEPDGIVLSPLPGSARAELVMALIAWLAVAGAVVVSGWLGLACLWDGQWTGGAIFLVTSLPFLLLCVLFGRSIVHDLLFKDGPPRFLFDRRDGQLVIDRRRGARKAYHVREVRPLTGIVGVQLLYSGFHSFSHTSDSGPSTSEQFHTYEMNLLLDDADHPRLHLCAHSDWEWMRREGGRLAEFLRVPVVDQIHPVG